MMWQILLQAAEQMIIIHSEWYCMNGKIDLLRSPSMYMLSVKR